MMIAGGEEDRPVHLGRGVEDRQPLAVQPGRRQRPDASSVASWLPWPLSQRKMLSTMMTVASTIRPKSIAPTDSSWPNSPRSTRMPIAKNSANGIVVADDDGAAQIAEEHPLQEEDQHDADDHVVQDGARGDVDQVLAVVDALDAHAGRQDTGRVDPLDLLLRPALIVGMLFSPRRISTMPWTMSSSSSLPAMPSRGWLADDRPSRRR